MEEVTKTVNGIWLDPDKQLLNIMRNEKETHSDLQLVTKTIKTDA